MLDDRPHNQPIRVLLVDDHPAVRIGIRKLIDDQPDMLVVAEAASAREAVGRSDCHSDVAIVDYHLGGAEDGLWLTTELKRLESAPRVLVYSAFADGALAVNALIVGADGLLGKHELGEEVCSAIRRLACRTAMVRALSPARYEPTVPPGPRTPLDYERPRRRSSRAA